MHPAPPESHVDQRDGPGVYRHQRYRNLHTLLEAARCLIDDTGASQAFQFTTFRRMDFLARAGAEGCYRRHLMRQTVVPILPSRSSLLTIWCGLGAETYGLPVVTSNCSNNYGPFHFPEKKN
jgi:dTDP-glucose 4,6-dehydratase